MRGTDRQTAQMFSYLSPAAMVPQDHPLRVIRPLANAAPDRLSPAFSKLYSAIGRPSIPPEQLLRALLLRAFFSVRSERQLMEQLTYNLMFRWFVGLSMDAPAWDVTVFTKNRDRLLEGDIARGFLQALLADPQVKPLLSDDHFSVDGTLIEAWAWMKSFRPKDGSGEPPADGRNGERDFHNFGPPGQRKTPNAPPPKPSQASEARKPADLSRFFRSLLGRLRPFRGPPQAISPRRSSGCASLAR